MRVKCPHCSNPIEIVATDSTTDVVVCPSCGSNVSDGEQTLVLIRSSVKTLGRFELIEMLGRGYFGEVWLAEDTELHRKVAVKIPRTEGLNDDAVERFLREAKAAASLKHPNIVAVHEIGNHDGIAFIVSEFIDGFNLAETLRQRKFSARESAELVLTVADALHHAHESGIVHRDLKPGNILVDPSGKPYLTDFGLAKQDAGEITITVAGQILGTPAYMSPEQARGEGHQADRRSDVYSLGVVLYELMTGCKPFKGTLRLLVDAIQNSDPDPPSKHQKALPRDLETICLKAMSKETSRRYATALEMAQDLRRFLNGEPILGRRASSFERGWRWIRRNPRFSTACAVASVAIMALVGVLLAKPTPGLAPDALPHQVRIDTVPTGATVVFYPLNPNNGQPQPEKRIQAGTPSPTRTDLLPGDYLVVCSLPDGRFHEVYRRIPHNPSAVPSAYRHRYWTQESDGSLTISAVEIPENNIIDAMALIDAGVQTNVTNNRRIVPYYMDKHEVTNQQILAEYKTTRPPSLFGADIQPNSEPITRMLYDDILTYAERVGKRLPTEDEYEFAATNGGTTRFPWGDTLDPTVVWSVMDVTKPTADTLLSNPSVTGLFSNAPEWTASWFVPKGKELDLSEVIGQLGSIITVKGGPFEKDPKPDQMNTNSRAGWHREVTQVPIGFRCA